MYARAFLRILTFGISKKYICQHVNLDITKNMGKFPCQLEFISWAIVWEQKCIFLYFAHIQHNFAQFFYSNFFLSIRFHIWRPMTPLKNLGPKLLIHGNEGWVPPIKCMMQSGFNRKTVQQELQRISQD